MTDRQRQAFLDELRSIKFEDGQPLDGGRLDKIRWEIMPLTSPSVGAEASMILSKILLCACILAVARPRPFVYAIGALTKVRALRRFDFSFFRMGCFLQAAGSFLALFGWCVLNCHHILHRGHYAALSNDSRTPNVPGVPS